MEPEYTTPNTKKRKHQTFSFASFWDVIREQAKERDGDDDQCKKLRAKSVAQETLHVVCRLAGYKRKRLRFYDEWHDARENQGINTDEISID